MSMVLTFASGKITAGLNDVFGIFRAMQPTLQYNFLVAMIYHMLLSYRY